MRTCRLIVATALVAALASGAAVPERTAPYSISDTGLAPAAGFRISDVGATPTPGYGATVDPDRSAAPPVDLFKISDLSLR